MGDLAAGFLTLRDVFSRRVTDVGIDLISTAVTASTQAYNAAINQLLSVLVEDLRDNGVFQERYKLPVSGTLQPVDEYGRPKPVGGEIWYTQAYPMQYGAHAWGTNWIAMAKMTVEEANDKTNEALRADADWLIRHILGCLFFNAVWTFRDEQYGDLTVYPLALGEANVKYVTRTGALVNTAMYSAQANPIGAGADNPFPTVVRQLRLFPVNQGPIVTYIHNDQRASVEALAGFVPVGDGDIELGSGSDRLTNGGPTGHLGDELIGKVNGSWVAEWERMPSGYTLSHCLGTKPIVRRQQKEASLQGFIAKPVIQDGNVSSFEFYRHAGFAPRNRVGVHIRRIGNATYAPPADYAAMPMIV
jgi:hypothetical protein